MGRQPHLPTRERFMLIAYDLGQVVSLGVIFGFGALVVRRLVGSWTPFALWALCAPIWYVLMKGDFASFSEREPRIGLALSVLSAVLLAPMLSALFYLSQYVSRNRILSWGTMCVALATAAINHAVLKLDYPAAHLCLAAVSAALSGPIVSDWLTRLPSIRDVMPWLMLPSLVSLIWIPGPVVRSALLSSSGAVLAPFATEAWAYFEGDEIATGSQGKLDPAWLLPRSHASKTPPSAFAAKPKDPIVILLTVDGLRADLVNGDARRDLPNFKALRESGLSFTKVWSSAPATRAALSGLFLGTYVSQQNWSAPTQQKKKVVRSIGKQQSSHVPALLEQHGTRAVHTRAHYALAPGKGIGDGFSVDISLGNYAPTSVIADAMLSYLETHAQEGKQLIYSHALDTHHPYDRGTTQGSNFERYVAEVALVDAAIGKLRAGIRRLHLEDRAYLIISSDHGEAFGEHGRDFHASTLYEEMVRVPLLIEGPGIKPRVVGEPISLLDLSATLLDLFEVDVPGHFMGKSLVPFMRGDSPTLSRPIALESERGMRAMVFPDGMKALVNIHRGTRELYDLRIDPGEHINLSDLPMANAYFADLAAWFRTLTPIEGQ